MSLGALQDALVDARIRGRSHIARRLRGEVSARMALESAIESWMGAAIDRDADHGLMEAVHSLASLEEAASTVALFERMLKHADRDIKDPVLRHLPAWAGLKSGMEFVRDEAWGWQEKAATGWLEEHS